MTADRMIALFAAIVFTAFLGVLAVSVRRWDLWVAIALGVALVGYDLYTQLWARKGRGRR